ncbi:hypothetical protein KJ853_04195 [Patescibacteria group bacterium]|nr:hypothetical protein [Patescibacteria group bacterium]
MKKQLQGITTIIIILIIIAVLAASGGAYYYYAKNKPAGEQPVKSVSQEKKSEAAEEKVPAEKETADYNSETTKLATISDEPSVFDSVCGGQSIIFSKDGRKVAYRAKQKNGKMTVFINGQKGKEYDNVFCLTFSPDGGKLAYVVKQKENYLIVVNGQEGKAYPIPAEEREFWSDSWTIISSPVFSPDSKNLAYAVNWNSGKEGGFVVLNNQEQKKYAQIFEKTLTFSPDSGSLAYMATKGDGKVFAVINNKEEKPYELIGKEKMNLMFSPDSRNLAYIAGQSRKFFVVINGKEGKRYDGIMANLIFSPDSKKFAYLANNGIPPKETFMVTNETEGKKYEWETNGSVYFQGFTFSSDSRLVYMVETKKGRYVVLGNAQGEVYTYIDPHLIVFSPNGQRLAYIAEQLDVSGMSRNKLVVINGVIQKQYKKSDIFSISDLIFSHDNQQLAYKVTLTGEKSLVGRRRIIVGSKDSNQYDDIYTSPAFSADDRKVMYGARKGNELWWIVEDVDQFGLIKTEPKNVEFKDVRITDGEAVCEYKKGEYEMRVYDSEGRATGVFNKTLKQEIPRSVYENGNVDIFFPQDGIWEYELYAVKEGNYKLPITNTVNGKDFVFNAVNIPIFSGQTHRYKVDWKAVAENKNGVTLLVDNDGDGKFEKIISVSGTEFTCEEFLEQIN